MQYKLQVTNLKTFRRRIMLHYKLYLCRRPR